ncbi:hypothetical protein PsorP6_010476 [Peronosclerospora sorghi]|uniref:Uncharacterized protein n=1 Tax=Peronosclerospora sorghi TaxID=230839 RepID=A0ACC0VWA6_9STRA|nr:hypothetical protein PsorP6_010476 [Peronosclerospora sorghi]
MLRTGTVPSVLVAALVLVFALAPQASLPTRLVDARGLHFVSAHAFCTYHCSAVHVTQAYRDLRDRSECLASTCSAYLATSRPRTHRAVRSLVSFRDRTSRTDTSVQGDVHAASEDDKNVTIISVVSCQSVTDVTLSIGDPETDAFAHFYPAFAAAYDAMVAGANATFDACQLQFLQNDLLAQASEHVDQDADEALEVKPSLIKFATTGDELACIQAIRAIWPVTREPTTPFLTRSDQHDAVATVMLVHVSAAVGDAIVALACVESVTVLPAILKLMPFAKSSVALSRDATKAKEGPGLEIQLVQGVDTSRALKKLATRVTRATGIANLLSMPRSSSSAASGGRLWQAAVDNYDTWTRALAIVLDDEMVEWVDLQQTVTTSTVKTHVVEHTLRRESVRDTTAGRATRAVPQRRLDDYVEDVMGVNIMKAHNITGTSIVVGVTDTGLYIDHDQFDQASRSMYDREDMTARKVVYYQTFANAVDEAEAVTCGHGTHVAGILAGSSYSRTQRDFGIASSARIAFMDIGKQAPACAGLSGCEVSLETPGDVATLMDAQVAMGAKIFSFSWGTGANDYNTQTAQVDEYIYNHPEVLIVVAAGNSGDKGSMTISSPSGAKNVISVGASLNSAVSFASSSCPSILNENTVASFTSIGPTLDGRQKPDLVAPGMTIVSSQSEKPGSTVKSSAVCPLQGTSQATPVIAGMAVLLYEWLRDGWWKNGEPDPTYGMDVIPASLIKALLLHSSEAMSRRLVEPTSGVTSCVALEAAAKTLTSYPDFHQGYGKPTMRNIASFLSHTNDSSSSAASASGTNSIYFFPNSTPGSEPSVTEGSEVAFHFMLTASVNLRVTIVWTDPPGSVGSKTTLQNDLDLTLLVTNTSTVFYPLSGHGRRDALNNVEMVDVSYDQVLAAVTQAGMVVAPEGYIHVQAVVRGQSVKAGENATTTGQKFAIVASSSPSSTSRSDARDGTAGFWQPWMTIGASVLGSMALLFLVASVWRTQQRGTKPGPRRTGHALVSATSALKGAKRKMRRSSSRTRSTIDDSTSGGPHVHPNYRNIDAGGSRRPALEQLAREGRRGGGNASVTTAAELVRGPHRYVQPPPPKRPVNVPVTSARRQRREADAHVPKPSRPSRGDAVDRNETTSTTTTTTTTTTGKRRERRETQRRERRDRNERRERKDRATSEQGSERERYRRPR